MQRGWILGLVLVLAGCLDGGESPKGGVLSSSEAPSTTDLAAPPAPDAETGSLVVLVTTSEFAPVANAQIALDGTDLTGFTDAAGQATFNGLSPGKYTVLAAKPGYQSGFDKGKVVEILAGEISEIKMVLDPQTVLDAGNQYHKSLVFNGLIACSSAFAPGTGLGYTSYPCRGVNVAGTEIRDPNENSTHPWEVDSIHVQSLVIEATWTPSNGLNGRELHMGVSKAFRCTGSGTQAGVCLADSETLWTEGVSPLYKVKHETSKLNLTKFFGATPDKYPAKAYTTVRSACTGSAACSTVGVQFQQKYEAWTTTFYGAEAPAGWSVYPPA